VRILIYVGFALTLAAFVVYWVAPVALSFYMANEAGPIARVVPVELADHSVSQSTGRKISYFGYEFESPWDDLDETQTKVLPKDNPNRALLTFRSGLHVSFAAAPPKEYINTLSSSSKSSPQAMAAMLGREAMQSDYLFVKTMYEFSPERMHKWATDQRVHNREDLLLILKSISLSRSAESGIFRIENRTFKGFQKGNPAIRQDGVEVDLYSDEGGVEFIIYQKAYKTPAGVSQAEINRIVQTMRRLPVVAVPVNATDKQ
jgi:hypothetical protein